MSTHNDDAAKPIWVELNEQTKKKKQEEKDKEKKKR